VKTTRTKTILRHHPAWIELSDLYLSHGHIYRREDYATNSLNEQYIDKNEEITVKFRSLAEKVSKRSEHVEIVQEDDDQNYV